MPNPRTQGGGVCFLEHENDSSFRWRLMAFIVSALTGYSRRENFPRRDRAKGKNPPFHFCYLEGHAYSVSIR